jgi:hypothetical protein
MVPGRTEQKYFIMRKIRETKKGIVGIHKTETESLNIALPSVFESSFHLVEIKFDSGSRTDMFK